VTVIYTRGMVKKIKKKWHVTAT